MAKNLTLGKKDRLKSKKLIDELFSSGHRFNVPPLRVSFSFTGIQGLRLGVGVSSKQFRKATDRNRIKRLLRESFRLQKPGLKIAAKGRAVNVFLTYSGKELPLYPEIFSSVEIVIKKLVALIHENTPAHS